MARTGSARSNRARNPRPAFYYARVIENPSCRYTARYCLTRPEEQRPAVCDAPAVPKSIQERAWTSLIGYEG